MPHFYATAADLLPVFASVESKRALRYTLSGHVDSISIKSFHSGAELPTLYQPAPSANAVGCPAYLVTFAGTDVVARESSTIQGPTRWAIDQLMNPDTTTLWHGGIYRDDILLYGRVATASKSKIALALQRLFESALRKQFVRVKSFYLGPEAESMLDKGARLTIGANSPTEYNLTR